MAFGAVHFDVKPQFIALQTIFYSLQLHSTMKIAAAKDFGNSKNNKVVLPWVPEPTEVVTNTEDLATVDLCSDLTDADSTKVRFTCACGFFVKDLRLVWSQPCVKRQASNTFQLLILLVLHGLTCSFFLGAGLVGCCNTGRQGFDTVVKGCLPNGRVGQVKILSESFAPAWKTFFIRACALFANQQSGNAIHRGDKLVLCSDTIMHA